MTLRQYFNPKNLQYINKQTSVIRSKDSYFAFIIACRFINFLPILVGFTPLFIDFKRVFEKGEPFYDLTFCFFIGAVYLSFLTMFAFLSIKHKIFLKRQTTFYFVINNLFFVCLLAFCVAYLKEYLPLKKEEYNHRFLYIWFIDFPICFLYYYPAFLTRLRRGVYEPLIKLWHSQNQAEKSVLKENEQND